MKTYLIMLIIVLSFAQMSCSNEQKPIDRQVNESGDAENTSTPPNDLTTPAESKSSASKPKCSLKVGFDVWEPYQYSDVNNTVRGLDIEIVSAVAANMQCSLQFVQGTWVSLLEELRLGKVDMLLGASKTPAREEFAYFSVPYRAEEFALYIRKDDPRRAAYADIQSFIEHDSKIGVVSDYFYGPDISAMLDNEESSKHFAFGIMGELNIARLLDMDIDGFLEDSFVGASMIRRKNLSEYIMPHGFTVQTGDIYVMLSKATVDQEQLLAFNQAMQAFKNSTDYRDIVSKYGR